jgi:prepilin-type processing-associated H-X9-DG protein
VAGSSDHATAESFNDGTGVTPPVTGRISFGGFFPPRTATNHSEFHDGLSNTLSVVEQSDFCRTSSGGAADCRSDCGHGFQMGKKASDERIFNTTTIHHPINTKGSSAFGVPGNCGPNRPILAAHLGGATALFADGSVHFLEESLELQVLYNLGNRDDGNALALPW